MTTYYGRRQTTGECVVVFIGDDGRIRRLPLRLDLYNHSPAGFEWGYAGSGPAQLALALLAHALKDAKRAVRLHQHFKRRVIAPMSRETHAPWELTSDAIVALADELSKEAAA